MKFCYWTSLFKAELNDFSFFSYFLRDDTWEAFRYFLLDLYFDTIFFLGHIYHTYFDCTFSDLDDNSFHLASFSLAIFLAQPRTDRRRHVVRQQTNNQHLGSSGTSLGYLQATQTADRNAAERRYSPAHRPKLPMRS